MKKNEKLLMEEIDHQKDQEVNIQLLCQEDNQETHLQVEIPIDHNSNIK
jgi:hypothetical protein